MADALLQILYPVYGGVTGTTLVQGCTAVTWDDLPPTGDLHDSSDGTHYDVTGTGDGVLAMTFSAYAEWFLESAITGGTISFVRLKWRARQQTLVAYGSTDLSASLNGTSTGATQTITDAFAEYSVDFATDPADAGAWTNARVNAYRWGAWFDSAAVDETVATLVLNLSELSVELWGVPVSANLSFLGSAHATGNRIAVLNESLDGGTPSSEYTVILSGGAP